MFVGFLPFDDSGLRGGSTCSAHLDPVVGISRVVAIFLSKSIDVAWTISFRGHSHEPIYQKSLVLFCVSFPMFKKKGKLFDLRDDGIWCNSRDEFVSNDILILDDHVPNK